MLVCRSTTSSSSLYSFLKTSDDYSLTNPNSTDEESRVSFVQLIHVRLGEESPFNWCRLNLTEKWIFLVVFKGLRRFKFILRFLANIGDIFFYYLEDFFEVAKSWPLIVFRWSTTWQNQCCPNHSGMRRWSWTMTWYTSTKWTSETMRQYSKRIWRSWAWQCSIKRYSIEINTISGGQHISFYQKAYDHCA